MSYQEHHRQAGKVIARCAVITLSDSRTAETDVSGKCIIDILSANKHAVAEYQLIANNPDQLRSLLTRLLQDEKIDVLLCTGGTGISKRDQTVEVVQSLAHTILPGFGELFRMLSWQQIGSGAMMSRAIAGIANGKIIFAMPGSPDAVRTAMEKLIIPELAHLLAQIRK